MICQDFATNFSWRQRAKVNFEIVKGKSSATTVATIQTMRDAAHEVGEISDTVGEYMSHHL